MKFLVAFLVLAWPLAATAQTAPRSIADCEKVKGDLAYNQCLASFGPPARGGGARTTAGEIDVGEQAQPEAPERGGSARRGRGSYGRTASYGRGRSGRQSAAFDIVSRGSSEAGTPRRARSSRYRFSRRR